MRPILDNENDGFLEHPNDDKEMEELFTCLIDIENNF